MTIEKQWEIRLTYFKPGGKFYASGTYMTERESFYEVIEEISQKLINGNRPGLCDGYGGFHVVVDASKHPHGYPVMFPYRDPCRVGPLGCGD